MSDGGAAVIVQVGSLLARTRSGRILLLVVFAYLMMQWVVSQLSWPALLGIGVVLAAIAGIAIHFYLRRKARRGRAKLLHWLALSFAMLLAGGAAIFVLLRRRRASALAPPPSPEEVERLVAEGGGAS